MDVTQYNSVFTDGEPTVTFTPQDGSGAQQIPAIEMPPAMPEDVAQGRSVIRLWVNFCVLSPQPSEGDVVTVAGVNYVIANVGAEPSSTGGAILKLRIT